MTEVWALDLPDSQKIVLLALADSANDEGICWPSMASLSKKCSKSERTVQGVIKDLVSAKLLTRDERPGKGCIYTVHPRSGCAPAKTAPPQGTTQTPAAAADKPSRTTINGLSDDKPKRARAIDPFPKPEWADEQVWTDLKTNRKTKRVPNTPTAYAKFLREIERWVDDAWPPGRVLEAIVARGWASAQYDPRENQTHGRPAQSSFSKPAGNRGERRNPCLDMLYAAEEELRTTGDPEPDIQAWPSLRAIQ